MTAHGESIRRYAPGAEYWTAEGCHINELSNTGQGDLVFLATCTPRFRPEAYDDAGGEEPPPGPAGPAP